MLVIKERWNQGTDMSPSLALTELYRIVLYQCKREERGCQDCFVVIDMPLCWTHLHAFPFEGGAIHRWLLIQPEHSQMYRLSERRSFFHLYSGHLSLSFLVHLNELATPTIVGRLPV
jgi:hypothetical protein